MSKEVSAINIEPRNSRIFNTQTPILFSYLASLSFVVVAALYTYGNLAAPVHRDAAHFLFMTKNITFGQPPYWASFETKNPLVELFWSPFVALLSSELGIAPAARIAEGVWLVTTAGLLFLILRNEIRASRGDDDHYRTASLATAILTCLFYLSLSMDARVTDDGLNISLYQSLPELLVFIYLLTLKDICRFSHGLYLGIAIFLAWFVKQTSIVPVSFFLFTLLFFMHRQLRWAWVAGVLAGMLGLVAIFLAHLSWTGTWSNYILGTHLYKASIISLAAPTFFQSAAQAYMLPQEWTLESILATHKIWTGTACIFLTFAALGVFKKASTSMWSAETRALLLAVVWMWGVWTQAVLSLTFFSHYFLASIAPVCLCLGLVLIRCRRWSIYAGVVILTWLTAGLFFSYSKVAQNNQARRDRAPVSLATKDIAGVLRDSDKVFNWSGLPHILIDHAGGSAYPQNMIWPYIMTGQQDQRRATMLKKTLTVAPDVVISSIETYPANQGLRAEPMTSERLYQLTGYRYELVLETPTREGRYGNPWQVFRRQ